MVEDIHISSNNAILLYVWDLHIYIEQNSYWRIIYVQNKTEEYLFSAFPLSRHYNIQALHAMVEIGPRYYAILKNCTSIHQWVTDRQFSLLWDCSCTRGGWIKKVSKHFEIFLEYQQLCSYFQYVLHKSFLKSLMRMENRFTKIFGPM